MDEGIITQEGELKTAPCGGEEMGVGEQGPTIFYNKFIKPLDKNNQKMTNNNKGQAVLNR